jgi:uroporphyrinogen-III synthase
MLKNNPAILITGELDDLLLKPLTSKGFTVDVMPFIKTETRQTQQIQQTIHNIAQLQATVVFTSSNAVEAAQHFVKKKKINWKIYCVGNSTRLLIESLFTDAIIIAVADNAAKLAAQIITNKESISEVYFFCGDKRRDELPLLLTQNNITVHEIEIYSTTILGHKLSKHYDGILFFSPSAVEGFFKSNAINSNTVLFAIGSTTADEIKRFSNNTIITADKPGKQHLIERVIAFFNAC